MRILRHLQHWLTGHGSHIHVADFVPETHPLRQGADTFPWAAGAIIAASCPAQTRSMAGPCASAPVGRVGGCSRSSLRAAFSLADDAGARAGGNAGIVGLGIVEA